MRISTRENFIEKCKSKYGDLYNYDLLVYKGLMRNIIVRCNKCNSIITIKAGNLLYKNFDINKCGKCDRKYNGTISDFIEKANIVHDNKFTYYIDVLKNKNKIRIKCNVCNNIFYQDYHSHLSGAGCIKCFLISQKAYSEEEFKAEVFSINNINVISAYTKLNAPVIAEDIFGLRYKVIAKTLLKPLELSLSLCINKTEFFKKYATTKHSGNYDYSNAVYKSSVDKVKIKCLNCGESFMQLPYAHLNGAGCPECKSGGWTYSAWEKAGKKSFNFSGFKLYIVELYDDNERFIKIGKTFRDVNKRFSNMTPLYSVNIIYVKQEEARIISKIEKYLHAKLRDYKHTVKKPFMGDTECFQIESLPMAKELILCEG